MQNYIIKTNEKFESSLKIPKLYKFAVNAIFLEDLNNEELWFILPYSEFQEKISINLKDKKLYWNEFNQSEIFWRSIVNEQNSIFLESNLNIYINITFIPIQYDINIEPLNFNDERFLIINRLFCNKLSIEDCPYDFFQCYNHQTNKNINFCSLYNKTNNTEITEIEKNYRKKIKQISDNYNNNFSLELEKNKQFYSNEYYNILNKYNNNKNLLIIIFIILLFIHFT